MSAMVILWILLAATAIAAIVRMCRRARRDSVRTLGFVSREWVEKYSTDHL